MRTVRSYRPGKGVVETRVAGEELVPRNPRFGQKKRRGEIWFSEERNRLEAHAVDGSIVGIEVSKGN